MECSMPYRFEMMSVINIISQGRADTLQAKLHPLNLEIFLTRMVSDTYNNMLAQTQTRF